MQKLLPIAVVLVALVHVAAGGDAKDDLKKLQGVWTAKVDEKAINLKITGNKFSFELTAEDEVYRGTFKLDPRKNPPHIDMTVTESTKDKFKGKTALGIYELKGDSFKWCANEPGKEERPTEFADRYLLVDFTRKK